MATVLKTLQDTFKDKKLTQLAKALTKSHLLVYDIGKLIDDYRLGTLDGGHTKEEEMEIPESALKVFEESYFKPSGNRVKIVINHDKNDFTYLHLVDNLKKFVLLNEDIVTASPNLKNSIDVDSYLAKMLKAWKLGMIGVRIQDTTYYYLFEQIPPMIKQSVLDEINTYRSQDKLSKQEQARLETVLEQAQKTYENNKDYFDMLDNLDSKRVLYDSDARKEIVYINSLKMLFG